MHISQAKKSWVHNSSRFFFDLRPGPIPPALRLPRSVKLKRELRSARGAMRLDVAAEGNPVRLDEADGGTGLRSGSLRPTPLSQRHWMIAHPGN